MADAASDASEPSRYQAEFWPLFGHSTRMRTVRAVIDRAADTDATVLIRGESGVGKDLVARAIHAASTRRDRPFVKVNCAALPADLLEAELFGHERGAFTGAYRRKPGKFEFAHTGTIFLDEIGELPAAVQPKLLQVLQDHEFSRIGGHATLRVDVRVIAATNRDVERALARGELREDLYYRLNVIEVHVPPLRERREAIQPLADVFLARFNRQYARHATLDPELIALFREYHWPGNVRELENAVRRLVVLGSAAPVLDELRARLRPRGPAAPAPPGAGGAPGEGGEAGRAAPDPDPAATARPVPVLPAGASLREIARLAAQEAERRALADVLARVRWNRSEAARVLKVSYKTLLARIADFQLAPGPFGPGGPVTGQHPAPRTPSKKPTREV
jgi:transcriptional regulator with GAF, ATPase, and Fis domain